jgi:hypothetical protein
MLSLMVDLSNLQSVTSPEVGEVEAQGVASTLWANDAVGHVAQSEQFCTDWRPRWWYNSEWQQLKR